MEKTRIGIPVALLAAMICLLGYYGGYVVAAVVVGYVLLKEESALLKRLAAKVLILLLAFSLINTVIGLLPDFLGWVQSLICIFDKHSYIEWMHSNFVTRALTFLSYTFSLLKMVLFLLMGILGLLGKELKVPPLDNALNKQFGIE